MRTRKPAEGEGEFPEFELPKGTTGTQPLPNKVEGIMRMIVQWGDETIQPIQYNGFHVGQIEVEVVVPPGTDPAELWQRTYTMLEELGKQQYQRKLEGFLQRAADSAKQVRNRAKNSP